MSAEPLEHSPSATTCDVWTIDLRAGSPASECLDVLSEAELTRAQRLRDERDRLRFGSCRAALRVILGEYLRKDPAHLAFKAGVHGRPYLEECELEFNVSHSADLGLVIVGTAGPLGVDLEASRPVRDVLELSLRYFHPEEHHVLEDAAPEDREHIFLTCWARKEAVLKSIGVGLTLDTRRIKVGASMEEQTMKLSWEQGRDQVRIRSFQPAPGYVAACVTPTSVAALRFRPFSPPA